MSEPSSTLTVAPHELLELEAFVTEFPTPIEQVPSPASLTDRLSLEAEAPVHSSDEVRAAVRRLLRLGGFKPSGRNKPASEYLIRAASNGSLGSINAPVDACNVASLHSGLPISVVDLDRAAAPLRVGIADSDTEYVFNASGQVIDVGGLLCLFDAEGACANAVKDAQRTKTGPQTTRTLSLIWGTNELAGRAAQTATWYRSLLEALGASTVTL
jgi:DNA/RNA-binding domain of Phe-tRNA-synthetase-like protein